MKKSHIIVLIIVCLLIPVAIFGSPYLMEWIYSLEQEDTFTMPEDYDYTYEVWDEEDGEIIEITDQESGDNSDCEMKHFNNDQWHRFVTQSEYVYYNEINAETGVLCRHPLFKVEDGTQVQMPHLHEDAEKITFFLSTYDIESGNNSEVATYYIIDLEDNVVKNTNIEVPYGYYTMFKIGAPYVDRFIIIYPMFNSGCDNEKCFQEAFQEFETEWNSSKVIVLDLNGAKYEFPANILPASTDFFFDDSSRSDLLAVTLEDDGYKVLKTFILEDIFEGE